MDVDPTEPTVEDDMEESPSYVEPVLVPRRKSTTKLLSPMHLGAPLAQSDNSLASDHEPAKILINSTLIDPPAESIVQSSENLVRSIENVAESAENTIQPIDDVIRTPKIAFQSADDAVESVSQEYADITAIAASYIDSAEQENSEPANIGIRINTIADISPEIMQEIIEHVRETFPQQFADQTPNSHQLEETPLDEPHAELESVLKFEAKTRPEAKPLIEPKIEPQPELTVELKGELNAEPKIIPRTKPKLSLEIDKKREIKEAPYDMQADAPMRPPSPNDYTPLSDIPTSFYGVRSGVSEDQSQSMASQSHVVHKHR